MTAAAFPELGANLERLRARIADAGGDAERVTVVAVTKGFGPEAIAAALAAGLPDVGESYAQEAVAKVGALDDAVRGAVRVHAIGRLQRNKVRALAPFVHLWQSVDRLSLAAEIARQAPGASALVQVNVSDEPQKGGCPPEQVGALVAAAGDLGLRVEGLMAVGAPGGAEAARPGFRLLRTLAADLDLAELSMGMSDDLAAAVAEGATMVRVGTGLFGPRPERVGGRGHAGGAG